MIFKIGSSASGTALLNYHMKKVEQDKAEVTYSSFNKEGCSALYYEGRFEDILSENGRVYKNRYLDISANFASEDNLSKAQKESVISEWMEEMGYGENAYILFHHKDKAHDHYHVVTVSVDTQGKKVVERDNYRRSVRVSRSLEERYGMRKLRHVSVEKGYAKDPGVYMVSRGLRDALRAGEIAQNDPILRPLEGNSWEQLNDKEFRACYVGHSEGSAYDYGLLHRHLQNTGRLIPNYKEQLRKDLLRYTEKNKSISGYFDNLERHGYYARVLTRGEHSSVVYGLRGTSYYISGEKLDYRLSYNGLATWYTEERRGTSLEERSRMKIERYIKRHVGRCLRAAYGAGTLESLLAKRGIEVVYAANKSGVYGVSFRSSYGSVKGHVVKGSAIGYSWQKLCWHLERNREVMVGKQVRLGRNRLGSKVTGVNRGVPLLGRFYASVMRGLPALQAVYAQQAAAAEWSMQAGLAKEAAIRQKGAQRDMEEGQGLEGDFSQSMGM